MKPGGLVPLHPDWLVPDWPAPGSVGAVFSSRNGGASSGNWAGFNLGSHVGDAPEAVAANRRQLADAIGARPVFLEQVHGNDVVDLEPATPDGTPADACFTTARQLACTVMVADCLPVLLTDASGRWVAAAHAGWRGLAGQGGYGILERTVDRVQAHTGCSASQLFAWLGPCIGPDHFEVGSDVLEAFGAQPRVPSGVFRRLREGKWLANLPGLARARLQALGVTALYGNDGSADWCTVANASRFFSHRRDRVSGRMAAAVWLR